MALTPRDPAMHTSFSRGETIGLLLDGEAGLASLLAALVILGLIFVRFETPGALEFDLVSSCLYI